MFLDKLLEGELTSKQITHHIFWVFLFTSPAAIPVLVSGYFHMVGPIMGPTHLVWMDWLERMGSHTPMGMGLGVVVGILGSAASVYLFILAVILIVQTVMATADKRRRACPADA